MNDKVNFYLRHKIDCQESQRPNILSEFSIVLLLDASFLCITLHYIEKYVEEIQIFADADVAVCEKRQQ